MTLRGCGAHGFLLWTPVGAGETHSDGKCKQWGSASHNNKIKFVGPGKPYPGLVRVRFFPYHYTITENQPVLEECVTQGHDKTELTFHVGRKNSKPPLEDFMGHRFRLRGRYRTFFTWYPNRTQFCLWRSLKITRHIALRSGALPVQWSISITGYWVARNVSSEVTRPSKTWRERSLLAYSSAGATSSLTFLGTEEGFTPPPTTSSFATISRFLIRASTIPHEQIHGHFRGFHHQLCLRTPVRVVPLWHVGCCNGQFPSHRSWQRADSWRQKVTPRRDA